MFLTRWGKYEFHKAKKLNVFLMETDLKSITTVTGKMKISEKEMVRRMLTLWASAMPMAILTAPKEPGPSRSSSVNE